MADDASLAEPNGRHLDSSDRLERETESGRLTRMTKKSEPNQLRPAPALVLARAMIRAGFRRGDLSMVRNGQTLFQRTFDAIIEQKSKCEQPELPFDADRPKGGVT